VKATVDQINRTRKSAPRTDAVRQPPNTREECLLCPSRRVSLPPTTPRCQPLNLSGHTPAFIDRSRYFASRPDLLSRVGGAAAVGSAQERTETQPIPTAALTTAAQRALANPAATRMLASGIQRAATTGSRAGGGGGGHHGAADAAAMAPLAAAALPSLLSAASAHDAGGHKAGRSVNAPPPSTGVGFGRVAAAAQAFSGSGTAPGHGTSASPPPAKAANPSKLVPQKVSKVTWSCVILVSFSSRSGSADPCSTFPPCHPPRILATPHSFPLVVLTSVVVVIVDNARGGRCCVDVMLASRSRSLRFLLEIR